MAYARFSGRLAAGCAVVGMGVLAACAQAGTMYSWETYQPQVYNYLKDDGGDYAEQIASLEENVEDARAAGQALPPGFRAHLGMLYLKLGRADKAIQQLKGEKRAFPESAVFMDFLLRNVPSLVSGAAPEAGGNGAAVPASRRPQAHAGRTEGVRR